MNNRREMGLKCSQENDCLYNENKRARKKHMVRDRANSALWSGTNKNRDVSTGSLASPFASPFARTVYSFTCSTLLALLTRSAALTRSLAYSRARRKVNDKMSQNDLVSSESADTERVIICPVSTSVCLLI